MGQAGKKAMAKANALTTDLVTKRQVDEETHAETWMPSKKRRKMNSCRDHFSHRIDISKELDADFSCWKINLMSHWS